jgi:guanosine-3',5'-bis(diphosphate) 3'-pyrophosphohydrolase
MKALKLVINEMNSENGFSRHDGSHYYHHLVDVTQTLINFGVRNENIITAAILHDYIEDVNGVTEKMIESIFNKEVAHMVALLTKNKDINYHDNKVEMQRYLDRIFENEGACLIKAADRIHNFSSMMTSSPGHKMKQVVNTKEFFIPFFKKCRNEYVEFSHFFFHAKTVVEPIMYEIEENNKLRILLENK